MHWQSEIVYSQLADEPGTKKWKIRYERNLYFLSGYLLIKSVGNLNSVTLAQNLSW
jgi:hypothetical protein